MQLNPLYCPQRIDSPAFHLRYSWTGWPSRCVFPPQPDETFFQAVDVEWEKDGIRRLAMRWTSEQIQLTCSVKPTVSPVTFSGLIKGRLQYALRKAHTKVDFSRKVAFRTLGENSRQQVEAYISKQVVKEQFLDERFSEFMSRFTGTDSKARLERPTPTQRGRYWYNLHLVLVTERRMRFTDNKSLRKISETCEKVAAKRGYRVGARSVMPDHVHQALRGNIQQSPEEIALAMMNNIAYSFGQNAIFRTKLLRWDVWGIRHGSGATASSELNFEFNSKGISEGEKLAFPAGDETVGSK